MSLGKRLLLGVYGLLFAYFTAVCWHNAMQITDLSRHNAEVIAWLIFAALTAVCCFALTASALFPNDPRPNWKDLTR